MDDIHFKILDFIKRRFKTDCNWLNGKCTNEEKRKECVEVSKLVLCLDKE